MTKPNAAQTSNTKPTMAEILDKKKPLEVEVQVLIDPSYQERYRELEEAKNEAARNSRSGKADISQPGPEKYEREMDELLEEAADSVVTFRFRDIGRKNLDALAREHPPTKDQQDTYKKLGAPGVLEYNVDTFGPELVAATCIEPEITVKQAQTIFEEWGAAEVEQLFNAAISACRGRASVPLSKRGTGATSISSSKSITAPKGESPTDGS